MNELVEKIVGGDNSRIPKIIHYCWFGGNDKPELIQKCMASWKVFCPDYEIIEWNESNFDVHCCKYVADAYAAKKWAFVSDYARLWAVYHYGGIYLDTDVELKKSLDELLQYDAWFAQDDIRYIATGLGFGAVPFNRVVKRVMDAYMEYTFPSGTNVTRDTIIFEQALEGWEKSKNTILINDILIIGFLDIGKYLRHLYTFSWGSREDVERRTQEILHGQTAKQKFMWKIKSRLRSSRMIKFLDSHKGTKIEKVLTFCLYDLLDCGVLYYIKRVIYKTLGLNR